MEILNFDSTCCWLSNVAVDVPLAFSADVAAVTATGESNKMINPIVLFKTYPFKSGVAQKGGKLSPLGLLTPRTVPRNVAS